MPGQRKQDVVPRTISSMLRVQIAHIAASKFNMPLSMRGTVAEMAASVSALMRARKFCPNPECGAGTADCNPEAHLFEPSEYMEDLENPPAASDDEGMLNTSQLDVSIGSKSTPAVDTSVLEEVDDPPADPRRALALKALADAGLDAEEYMTAGLVLPQAGSSGQMLPPPQPTPSQARHVPPAPAPLAPENSLMETMSRMVALLERQQNDRASEIELQRQQTLKLTEALCRKTEAPRADSGPEDRVAAVLPLNAVALGQSGVTLGNQFGVHGDITKIDLSKRGKLLNSGRDPSAQLKAVIPETWPNQFLHPVIWPKIVKYCDLTLLSFCVGFVTKAFSEYEPNCPKCGVDRNGSRGHNVLRMLMELLKVAETHSFADTHMLGECLFSALERGTLKWEDWDGPQGLGIWWNQMFGALQGRSGVFKGKRPRQAEDSEQPGKPAKTPALDPNRPVMGVPGDWLKNKKICINFNLNKCKQAGPHDTYDKSGKVNHYCGGCAYLGKSSTAEHAMKTCPNKNEKNLFC